MTNLIFAYLTIGAVIAGIIVTRRKWVDAMRAGVKIHSLGAMIFASSVVIPLMIVAWPAFLRDITR